MPALDPAHGEALLDIARRAIHEGTGGRRLRVRIDGFPEPLRALCATFVTLEARGELRGCIGTLHARRALVEDVAHHAYAAAFEDPRFPPVSPAEVDALDIRLSLLSPLEPVRCASESDLLTEIRPHVHGLVLEEGPRRGAFLPSVWAELPDARDFLRHLKRKAGLPPDYWSATLSVSRFTAASVP